MPIRVGARKCRKFVAAGEEFTEPEYNTRENTPRNEIKRTHTHTAGILAKEKDLRERA